MVECCGHIFSVRPPPRRYHSLKRPPAQTSSVFAYSNQIQMIGPAFTDVTFNVIPVSNGWTLLPDMVTFLCPGNGLYIVNYAVQWNQLGLKSVSLQTKLVKTTGTTTSDVPGSGTAAIFLNQDPSFNTQLTQNICEPLQIELLEGDEIRLQVSSTSTPPVSTALDPHITDDIYTSASMSIYQLVPAGTSPCHHEIHHSQRVTAGSKEES